MSPDSRVSVGSLAYVVRTSVPPATLFGVARERIRGLDPELPIMELGDLEQIVSKAEAPAAFAMSLMIIAAAVALTLGTIGVYGILSFLVSQRTGEIGIRMALGADRHQINRMILGQGIAVTAVGITLGLVGAAALTRLMSNLLFGVSPLDPATYVTVAAVLLAATLAASYLPARRAAALDPLESLRSQ